MTYRQIDRRNGAIASLTQAIESDKSALVVENRFGKAVLTVQDVPNIDIKTRQQQGVLMTLGNGTSLSGPF
jgi:hypothetical protein